MASDYPRATIEPAVQPPRGMSTAGPHHITLMRRALALAARGWGRTSPNPLVGAVVVKKGTIIASDYHKKAGEPHAEALALRKAGRKAHGSTLYVTLEPCCHKDKRTPPCTGAIVAAGIAEVIVAMEDPNPKVAGKGIEELRRRGLRVHVGVCEDRARKLNEAYIKHITTGIPFVTLKIAMTLDGKIATPEGQSKWITGGTARKFVHYLRRGSDAILTAIGTVKADDPEMTSRLSGKNDGADERQPVRVVIDADLDIPLGSKILRVPPPTVLVTREPGKSEDSLGGRATKRRQLKEKGIRLIDFQGDRADLRWLVTSLGEEGITSVMVEGGASLSASALQDGIVDKVLFFIAPKLIGGRESIPAVGGSSFRRIEEAYQLRDARCRRIGDDFLIEGYLGTVDSPIGGSG